MNDSGEIQYNYYFWGPLLWRTKIFDKDLKQLKRLCKRNNKLDYRKNLAGVIDNEYKIDAEKFTKIINKYIYGYFHAYKLWYNKPAPGQLKVDSVWVNYMKKGESNPMHIHIPCDLSSVLYLDVPKKLLKEQEQFVGKAGGPGAITFFNQSMQDYFIGQQWIRPETGDFFIFPAMLCHSVATFQSDVERVSMAANFNFEGGKYDKR